MIPRIIHQIWLQGGDLPSELQRNVDDLKALNPGWEHRLYDASSAEALLSEIGPSFAQAYRRINPRYRAARADFLRHAILFLHGGVYLDIKSGFTIPLDQTIRPNDSFLLCRVPSLHKELPDGEYLTHFLICRPAHPITARALADIRDNILDYKPWHAVGRNGVLRTTGPIAFTKAVEPDSDYRLVTEAEMGAYYSCTDTMLPGHYSTLRQPVARLNPLSSAVSRVFTGLRAIKRAA